MDLLPLLVTFVAGAFTGAAGTYLGQKYTDKRRNNEAKSESDRQWEEICSRFPNVIDEMRKDARNEEFSVVRKFFVKSSKTTVNMSEPHLEYYTDVHPDLDAAISHLEDMRYIEDITPGNCPMYRMYEHFVDRLKNA